MADPIQLSDSTYGLPWRLPPLSAASFALGIAIILLISHVLSMLLWPLEPALAVQNDWQKASYQGPPAVLTARTPAIFVQGGLAAPVGSLVDVPIAFDSASDHVAALSFSLDYDDTCLAFDPADQNHDNLPDAIVVDAPTQFFPSISVNPDGQKGRLNVVLADYIPPLAALHDTAALITIQFRIVCPVAPGDMDYASVGFAATPAVGFSDSTGRDLPGVTRAGVVQVIGAIPSATPTPTLRPTPLAGSPPPTIVPAAPSTPPPSASNGA